MDNDHRSNTFVNTNSQTLSQRSLQKKHKKIVSVFLKTYSLLLETYISMNQSFN